MFVPGSGWVSNENYTRDLVAEVRRADLRLVPIVYDILPINHPEYVLDRNVNAFKFGFSNLMRYSMMMFTISQYSLLRIQEYCRERRFPVPETTVFRLGEETTYEGPGSNRPSNEALLPLNGRDFVIFVSTINPRKNHQTIYRVWQRLVAQYGERTPCLVFVGGKGWESDDFLALLARDSNMVKHLLVTGAVDENDIDWLYRNCKFTVYPSLAEGWGLPIAESLQYGKLCVCSSATAMQEVSPDLTITIDPLDVNAWTETIGELIKDESLLHEWELRIRSGYRATRWKESAESIWDELNNHVDETFGSRDWDKFQSAV